MNNVQVLKFTRLSVQAGITIMALFNAYLLFRGITAFSPGVFLILIVVSLLVYLSVRQYKVWNERIAFQLFVYENGLDTMPADEAVDYMENMAFNADVNKKQRQLIVKYMLAVRGIKYTYPTLETMELNWPANEQWERVFGITLNQIVTNNWKRKVRDEHLPKPHEEMIEISSSDLRNHSTTLEEMPEVSYRKWTYEGDLTFYTVVFQKETEKGRSICYKNEQPDDREVYEDPEDFDYAFSSVNFVLDTDRSRHTVFISINGPVIPEAVEKKWIQAFETARLIPHDPGKKETLVNRF